MSGEMGQLPCFLRRVVFRRELLQLGNFIRGQMPYAFSERYSRFRLVLRVLSSYRGDPDMWRSPFIAKNA